MAKEYSLLISACRYDDAPWSDCDPFELIRYRVIHLVHGGHQVWHFKRLDCQV